MSRYVIRATNRNNNRQPVEWAGALYGWLRVGEDPAIFGERHFAEEEKVTYKIETPNEAGIPGDNIEEVQIVEICSR